MKINDIVPEKTFYFLLSLLCLIGLLLFPLIGREFIYPTEIFANDESRFIYLNLRLPRTLLAFIAGAVLSVCGMIFQSLFQNSLASPFTLGVSSGAAFAASLVVFFPALATLLPGGFFQTLSAFTGALGVMGLILLVAKRLKNIGGGTLLLIGVALNFFFSSLILLLQYLATPQQNFEIMRWLMGGFTTFGFDSVWQVFAICIPCLLLLKPACGKLNLLCFGEDFASTHGLDVEKSQRFFFLFSSLMTGAVVAVCGPISFVGMMIPHIFRNLGICDNRHLFIASLFGGAFFLMICDTLARLLAYPSDMPAGIVTSFVGSLFFFLIIFRKKTLLT